MTTFTQGWEDLYREESPRLWRALLAYSGSPDIASDAVAEAFTQAMTRRSGINDRASWIWTAAFRTAAGELKRRGSLESFADASATYEISEPIPHVFDALRRLSPRQRAVVVLHDYADRPTDEIAKALGMQRPTVYVHLSQARKRLRELLEHDDE